MHPSEGLRGSTQDRTSTPGGPSSLHVLGRSQAEQAVEATQLPQQQEGRRLKHLQAEALFLGLVRSKIQVQGRF